MKINILIVAIIFSGAALFSMDQSNAFGQQYDINNIHHALAPVQATLHSIKAKINAPQDPQFENDTLSPSINITYPSYPPTLLSGNITLKGVTNDFSDIKEISADAHTFPFNGTMTIKPAATRFLLPEGNLSKWSIPFEFKQPGVYRIVIKVRDYANSIGRAETTVNVVPLKGTSNVAGVHTEPRIAFVRYTFTEAAYQDHGFYNFYFKYRFPPFGKNITTDLDMLTVKTPRSISEFVDTNGLKHLSNITSLIPVNGTEVNDTPEKFWLPFIDHVKKAAPNATVTVIRDEDVHDGHIFYTDNNSTNYGSSSNKTNAYDVLLLFHNEYVTQQEYDNLRQFVKNGGTIVFIDPNIFYAEVNYDRSNHTITLVKGHDWKFDGKAASRSVSERWYNETKEWVGANYLINYIKSNTTFANNPFNYTHFEEQFVNNPKDQIIIDYGIKLPKNYSDFSKKNELPIDKKVDDIKVATYDLDYGKGKVIMVGLYAQNLAQNEDFMKFFDNVILPRALCQNISQCLSS